MSGVPPTATPCIVGCMMIRCSTIARVDLAAERIQAGEDRRDVIVEFALADDAAAGRFVIVAVAAGDDDDAATGGARGRLHDELAAVADQLGEAADVAVAADDGVRFGHGNAVLVADLLRDRLVVDARVQRARVALLDERQVALVDAEDAGLFQLVRPGEQRAALFGSKR